MAGFWEKLKLMFSSPDKLFEAIRDEGVGSSLLFPLYIFLVAMIIGLSETIFFHSSDLFGNFFGMGGSMSYFMFRAVFLLIAFFILAGIFHAVSFLLGAREGSLQTIKVSAYSSVPFWMVSAIPLQPLELFLGYRLGTFLFLLLFLLNLISLVYCSVLVVKGLVKLQGLSVGKGIAAVVTLFMLTILPLLLLLFLFTGAISGGPL